MPTIKLLLGVLAVSAVGLALLGANASADVLCEEGLQVVEEVEACLAPYPEATTVKGSAKEASFVSGEFKVTCNVELVWEAEEALEPGEGLEGQVKSLTFSSCKGACSSAKATGLPYGALAIGSKEGDGTVTWTATGEEGPGVMFSGCFGSSCGYESEELAFSVDGGEPAHVAGKGLTMERTSGTFCPASGSFSADYELQQPNGGVLAIAQDVGSISLSPIFPAIGLNQQVDITILNSGTVGWNISTISLTNATDFDKIDPLPGKAECKGQTLTRNMSCKVGVKCKTLNTNTILKVDTGIGLFTNPVVCQ